MLTPFTFEHHVAHGAIVQLRGGIGAMFDNRHYAPAVRELLGQAMAAMPLLGLNLSFEGRINLQFQSESATRGPSSVELLVAQVDHQRRVRAMAKAPADAVGPYTELLAGGTLALMIEPRESGRPATQAIVDLRGAHLQEALEGYFARSEQLPTLIRLAVDQDRVAGFMLQRLPLESSGGGTDDDWEHLRVLAATITDAELLDLEPQALLLRLFADAPPLRVFPGRDVRVECNCSRASIARLLQSLGRSEVDAILQEQPNIEITCEFCGRAHRFTPMDAAELFVSTGAQESGSVH